jgi:hypothetical protein
MFFNLLSGKRTSNRKSSAHFPGDLFSLLLFPAFIILFAVAGFRYSRLVMVFIG